MIAGIEDPKELTWIMRPFFRDLPYDFSTLLENVADPSHVPFSHHGVQGNRDSVKYGMFDMEKNGEARWGGRTLDNDEDNFHVRAGPSTRCLDRLVCSLTSYPPLSSCR